MNPSGHYEELNVYYERDPEPEKDHAWIRQVTTFDEDGEEMDVDGALEACGGVNTCRDQGRDLEVVLRLQVEAALRSEGFSWSHLDLIEDSDASD